MTTPPSSNAMIRELEDVLNVKVFQIIKDLMEMDLFAHSGVQISVDVIEKVIWKYGGTARKAV